MPVNPIQPLKKERLDLLEQYGRLREEYAPSPGSPIAKQIENFAILMVSRMKQNLTDAGKYNTGALIASITFEELDFSTEGEISVTFIGEDYVNYVNEGVNGIPGEGRQFGSSFSFHRTPDEPSGTNAWTNSVLTWIRDRGIRTMQWTDSETGELVVKELNSPEDFEAAAFLVIRGLKNNGIAPTHFVEDAFSEEEINQFELTIKELWR